MKKRLDLVLVERGLAESRAQAQALVLAGLVRGYDKPGTQVDDAADLTVERPPPYVSRGGEKLANALDRFGIDPAGLVKPQFEAGRAEVGKGGVVRDPEVRRRVLRETAEAALGWGASVAGVVDSGLPGPKGNRELFLHLVSSGSPALPDDLDARIDDALAQGS